MQKRKSTETIARMLAGLPEVRAIVEREEQRKNDATLNARMAAIERVAQAREVEVQATETLTRETQTHELARAQLEAATSALRMAEQAHLAGR